MATVDSVLRISGCPYCSGTILTKDAFNKRLRNDGKRFQIIGDYNGITTKTLFGCDLGHKWISKPSCASGCPDCSSSGFSVNKSSVIYLLDFGTHIKYGISNSIESRLKSHKRNGSYDIIMMVECSGQAARDWENLIKNKFGGNYVDKSIMPDGYTETLSPEYINEVKNTMNINFL